MREATELAAKEGDWPETFTKILLGKLEGTPLGKQVISKGDEARMVKLIILVNNLCQIVEREFAKRN